MMILHWRNVVDNTLAKWSQLKPPIVEPTAIMCFPDVKYMDSMDEYAEKKKV